MTAAAGRAAGLGRTMSGMSPPLRLLTILLRSHARGLESWIGALVAVAALGILACSPAAASVGAGARMAVAILLGACAQAAAGAVGAATSCGTRLLLPARICWPVGGACLAALLGHVAGGPGAWGEIAAGVSLGAAATAATATACGRRGLAAADCLSAALVTVACGAAAACATAGIVPPLVAAVMGGSVAAVAIRSLAASFPPGGAGAGRRAERPSPAATLLGHGPARSALSTAAMATALAGMVGWFFLDPAKAAWYPLLAATWFVCLAVPQAVALPVAGRGGELGRSAAGADGVWWQPAARRARASAAAHALVLGWPAAVALALYGSGALARGEHAVWPLATLVGLAGAAASMAVVVCIAYRWGLPPGRVHAVVFAAVAAGVLAAFAILPVLPVLPLRPRPSDAGGRAADRAVAGVMPENQPKMKVFHQGGLEAVKPRLRKWPVWNDN